ncbi:hypothetical protein SAMN05428953_108217 [Mesorhizobium muleiense]|uniref:Uncharacterized protein n=2 Tax=Mesorhizobium muleiense TaxID=1004279 RepID=A0A1G8W6X7_9HYPH|nr:hypothetical protein SAMN05428953_108217 [Mesorhizobium muleiense]
MDRDMRRVSASWPKLWRVPSVTGMGPRSGTVDESWCSPHLSPAPLLAAGFAQLDYKGQLGE